MQILLTYTSGRVITDYVHAVTPAMSVGDPVVVATTVRQYANTHCGDWMFIDFTIMGVGVYKVITLVNDDYKTMLTTSRSNTAICIHEYEENGAKLIKSIVV